MPFRDKGLALGRLRTFCLPTFMQLKDSEKDHLKNWGFSASESDKIELHVVRTGAGSLHNFQKYCLQSVSELLLGQNIVWPPVFKTFEKGIVKAQPEKSA
jgi:hypothetical protein